MTESPPKDQVQLSIPKSFFDNKGLLALVLGGSILGGAGSGYISGGLSAEQRLEVVDTVNAVRDEIRQDISGVSSEVSEVSDDVDELSRQVSGIQSQLSYLRGKLGLNPRLVSEELDDFLLLEE